MYQKQILFEKLKEATASVLPISLIVMAISFVLVPVDAGLMLSFILATAMLILGMGLFTLGADMSMSRIGNYMGSKMTKSRKLGLVLVISFALGVAITVAEPDLQVLAGNVPEIDTKVLILTVSVGVGFFLMLCMVRILFSISLRTMLIVFYAIVFAAAFLSEPSILSVAFDSGGVLIGEHLQVRLGNGDEKAQQDTIRGLQSAEGYIRRELAHTLNMRNTPEIKFVLDQSIEYGVNMSKLIDDVNSHSEKREDEHED